MPFGQLSAVGVRVRVWVGVEVDVSVGVTVEVAVAVDVGDGVGVSVSVGDGVTVGPSNPPGPQAEVSRETATTASANLWFIKLPPSRSDKPWAAAAPRQMVTSRAEPGVVPLYNASGRNSSGAAILHMSR